MNGPNREQLLDELSRYVAALMKSADETRRSEDRQKYTAHLASAAVIYHHLRSGNWAAVQQTVATEKRSFGWDFLDGNAGAVAEDGFRVFASCVDAMPQHDGNLEGTLEPITPANERRTLMLSIQRALLGAVTDRLVSVTCGIKDRTVHIKAYFGGEVTSDDLERVQMIGTEVIADFPEGYKIHETCASIDAGVEEMLGFWAFSKERQSSTEP